MANPASMSVINQSLPLRARISDVARRLWSPVWGPGTLAGLALFVVYMLTLQRIISGGDSPHMFDAGEMQVALNLWGTPHAPSYPLYILLGAPVVWLLKLVNVSPATAASTTSLLWGMAALALTYDLLRARTGRPWIAASLVLILSVLESVWLHNVIAEVYSLLLFFVALTLWWVLRDIDAPWTRKRWLILASILGLAVGHNRAAAFVVPALAIYLLPQFWHARRQMPLTLALGTLIFLGAALLPYLYIPLYARVDGRWVFGDPTTLRGLWRIISASDWNYLWDPPRSVADFGAHAGYVWHILTRQLTPIGLIAGFAALGSLFVYKDYPRRLAWFLTLSTATFLGFMLWFPEIVIDAPVPSGGLPLLLLVILALGESLAHLARIVQTPSWIGASLLLGIVATFVGRSYPFIHQSTRNPTGVQYIEHLHTLQPADGDTYFFITPWGSRYLAMAYALYVTSEIDGFEPIDHVRDPRPILARDDRLITTPEMLDAFPLDWWASRVDGDLYLRSAGPGFVELDDEPLSESPSPDPIPLDNGIILLDSEVIPAQNGVYDLSLYWQADAPPAENYSVFVHLTRADPPRSGEDVLAQADSYAPVSGWYPVTSWRPGEIVRDEYRIIVPDGYDGPLYLRVGMYRQLDDGSFENFDAFSQPLR